MSGKRTVPAVSSGAALGAAGTQDCDTKRPLEQEGRTSKRQKLEDGGHGAQIASYDLEAVILGVERGDIQAELEAARKEVVLWKAGFEAEAARREELERSRDGLKASLKTRYYEIEDLKREAEAARKERDAARKERDAALQARHQDELKLTEKLQGKLKAAHNKLSKYGLAASALAARKTDPWKYLAECDKQGEQNQALSVERDQLLAERDKLVSERDGLVAERDKLVAERDKLAAECSKARTAGQQWKTRAEEVSAERDGLLAECEEWEAWEQDRVAEREELDAEFEQVSAILDGERIVHMYTRGEFAAVSLMLEATENMVADRDKKIESLQEELDTSRLLKRLSSAWDEVLQVESQVDMYRRQAELLAADLAKRTESLSESQKKILDQEKQLISLTDQKGKFIEEIGGLKRTWEEERTSAARNSMRELDDLRAENILLCTQLDEVMAENGRLKA